MNSIILDPAVESRLASVANLIGDTPLLDLACKVNGISVRVLAKHEMANFTGSVKDRMALHIIRRAYADGRLKPGDTIAEATSGNTGISFAAIGRVLGHPVRIFMPDWMSRERALLVRSFGAEIIPVSKEEGGFLGSIEMADAFAAAAPNVFRPQQFSCPSNPAAHETSTGPELEAQLRKLNVVPQAFVAGVGTGGTVMGIGAHLRKAYSGITIHPLEPANSPTLTTGHKVGTHRIQGISDEFIPEIVKLDQLDSIVQVWDGDSILMAQRLASELGLAVGISSGANMLGALQLGEKLGEGAVVCTVFSDSNKKYLSTDLCSAEAVRDDYMTPHVELEGLAVHASAGI
ncbi:MAG: PLP-dependent cysteine synthase family protein [Planctomycetes bacterium]|nr:PLP-dependent cysteine synthase family protein [Planctomycetota bacterium]